MDETILFKRNQFSTRLPTRYLYTLSHFWLERDEAGLWRVGPTRFATRMLGEIVELDFELDPGAPLEVAQVLGWIEGFKATSDLYSVGRGSFGGPNREALENPGPICKDPYRRGWLYSFDGEPDPGAVDVHGYASHLEATIDKMLEKPWRSGDLASD